MLATLDSLRLCKAFSNIVLDTKKWNLVVEIYKNKKTYFKEITQIYCVFNKTYLLI